MVISKPWTTMFFTSMVLVVILFFRFSLSTNSTVIMMLFMINAITNIIVQIIMPLLLSWRSSSPVYLHWDLHRCRLLLNRMRLLHP